MDLGKKVMIITSSGHAGGVEKITHTLWKELKKENINLKVVKIFKSSEEEFYKYGKDEITFFGNKVFIERNFIKKIFRLIKDVIVISYYKKKNNIEYSIGMGEMCSILNGLTFSRDFKIGSIHGKKVFYKNPIINSITSQSFDKTNKIICISQGVKNDIIKNFKNINPWKLEVIYNPHEKSDILLQSSEELNSEEKRIFSKKTFIYVGRIDDNKGLVHLLRIFKEKKEKMGETNLVVIGDNKNIDLEYKKLIERFQLDNVYFLGHKSNPYKYIKNAYGLVLTSYSEGLPNVLVEALILGIPVISTNSSEGIWEIIEKESNYKYEENLSEIYEGEFGLITPKFSIQSLQSEILSEEEEIFYQGLLKLLNKDIYLKIQNNIKKFGDKFKIEKIIEKYKDLFREKEAK